MTKNKKIGLILGTLVLIISAGAAISNLPALSTTQKIPSTATNTTTTTAKTYTLADVATHDNTTSCWTVVNGEVYDVTSWINEHPGGKQAIIGMCGIDGSETFNGQHGGQSRPASELATFKIGSLTR